MPTDELMKCPKCGGRMIEDAGEREVHGIRRCCICGEVS